MDVRHVTLPVEARLRWWVKPALRLGLWQLVLKYGAKFRIANGRWRNLDLTS